MTGVDTLILQEPKQVQKNKFVALKITEKTQWIWRKWQTWFRIKSRIMITNEQETATLKNKRSNYVLLFREKQMVQWERVQHVFVLYSSVHLKNDHTQWKSDSYFISVCKKDKQSNAFFICQYLKSWKRYLGVALLKKTWIKYR